MDRVFGDNITLKAILLGQFGDYGMIPEEASFFIHAGVVAHYLDGGYYPIGGPQVISKALIPTIHSTGGRVLVNSPVKKLTTSGYGINSQITGVELENGAQLVCDTIISAAGALATDKLVQQSVPEWSIFSPTQKVTMKSGISHMYAYIGIDGDTSELNLRSSNLWALPSVNISEDCKAYYEDPFHMDEKEQLLMFLGFPSAKDPNFHKKYPGKSTCVIITEAKSEWFEQFNCKDAASGKRKSVEYSEYKDKFKNILLNGLYKEYKWLYSEYKINWSNPKKYTELTPKEIKIIIKKYQSDLHNKLIKPIFF